jgi:hypothetical protein
MDRAGAAPDGLTKVNCHICAGGCQATPLLVAPPVVMAPAVTAEVEYPSLSARAPAFQSEGPERPPRTA